MVDVRSLSTPRTEESPAPGAPKILAAEDDAGTRLLYRAILQADYDLAFASDFETALERAQSATFDLVLVDISLRGTRNGVDLLKELRTEPDYTDVPLIAITAHAMPGDQNRFLTAGFDAYVAKPFTRQTLAKTIQRYLPDHHAAP